MCYTRLVANLPLVVGTFHKFWTQANQLFWESHMNKNCTHNIHRRCNHCSQRTSYFEWHSQIGSYSNVQKTPIFLLSCCLQEKVCSTIGIAMYRVTKIHTLEVRSYQQKFAVNELSTILWLDLTYFLIHWAESCTKCSFNISSYSF